jgi:hypothetical protein
MGEFSAIENCSTSLTIAHKSAWFPAILLPFKSGFSKSFSATFCFQSAKDVSGSLSVLTHFAAELH